MKLFCKDLKFVLFTFLILATIFSFSASAQKRKPVASKKTQIQRFKAQGFKQFQSRQLDAAIESFSKCIALKPMLNDADDCYFGRGTAYFLLEKYEEAIPDFGEAYSSFLDFNAMYLRGRAYFELKKFAEAHKDFNLVVLMVEPEKIKKSYPEIYGYRGATYIAADKLDEGIADYTKAIELKPQSADFYYARGLAYDMKNDFPNAEKDLRETLRLDPSMKSAVEVVFKRIEMKKNADGK
jgi:tetratricopeptide (TPR) repeat protein